VAFDCRLFGTVEVSVVSASQVHKVTADFVRGRLTERQKGEAALVAFHEHVGLSVRRQGLRLVLLEKERFLDLLKDCDKGSQLRHRRLEERPVPDLHLRVGPIVSQDFLKLPDERIHLLERILATEGKLISPVLVVRVPKRPIHLQVHKEQSQLLLNPKRQLPLIIKRTHPLEHTGQLLPSTLKLVKCLEHLHQHILIELVEVGLSRRFSLTLQVPLLNLVNFELGHAHCVSFLLRITRPRACLGIAYRSDSFILGGLYDAEIAIAE